MHGWMKGCFRAKQEFNHLIIRFEKKHQLHYFYELFIGCIIYSAGFGANLPQILVGTWKILLNKYFTIL